MVADRGSRVNRSFCFFFFKDGEIVCLKLMGIFSRQEKTYMGERGEVLEQGS